MTVKYGMKFYAGTDYPWLCGKCRVAVDQCVEEIEARVALGDEDLVSGRVIIDLTDNEAPIELAGDRRMLCDGGECNCDCSIGYPSMDTSMEKNTTRKGNKMSGTTFETYWVPKATKGRMPTKPMWCEVCGSTVLGYWSELETKWLHMSTVSEGEAHALFETYKETKGKVRTKTMWCEVCGSAVLGYWSELETKWLHMSTVSEGEVHAVWEYHVRPWQRPSLIATVWFRENQGSN
jgi:ribosomal protein S27AE